MSSGCLSGLALVEQHETGVRLDSVRQRGGLSDVEIAPKLHEQQRVTHRDDIERASIVQRSKCVHTVVTAEAFFPDPFEDRHGRKLVANEIESVDRREMYRGV